MAGDGKDGFSRELAHPKWINSVNGGYPLPQPGYGGHMQQPQAVYGGYIQPQPVGFVQGYSPPHPGYVGYPPPHPGYNIGYLPPHPFHGGYPPPQSWYGPPPPQPLPPKFGGGALGLGLGLLGDIGGMLIANIISDVVTGIIDGGGF